MLLDVANNRARLRSCYHKKCAEQGKKKGTHLLSGRISRGYPLPYFSAGKWMGTLASMKKLQYSIERFNCAEDFN